MFVQSVNSHLKHFRNISIGRIIEVFGIYTLQLLKMVKKAYMVLTLCKCM